MSQRCKALEKRLADRTANSARGMRRLVRELRCDQGLLSELMAVCARVGPAENDSDWEYISNTDDPTVSEFWAHGGSGLTATHHLPVPSNPNETK